MAWDPTAYLNFGAERTRPAAELLARVDMAAPARVADLGCGPGNSAALLAARWPGARVDGLDNSREMLAEAANSGVPANWIEADLGDWTADAPYDVIFTNAALHWVPEHARLLPRLFGFVASGGVFAMQVPDNGAEPCHALMDEVAKGKSWARKFDGLRYWRNVLSFADYYGIFEPLAANIDIWETRYVQVLSGEDAVYRWMSGTGLRPFAAALEESERTEFLDAYRTALARAYPIRASSVTLYPFRRLFVVARAR